MPTPDLRILIVADNLLARTGLAALLGNQPDCRIVGQVSGGLALADDLELYRPDIIVYDLGWTPSAALETLALLRAIPVLALLPDDEQVGEVVGALREALCYGLLLGDSAPEMLVTALYAVAGGLLVIDPALSPAILPAGDEAPLEPLLEELTARESQVLQLLAEGLANKAIASALGISEHTVKFHVKALMTKLNAQSRTEAVVRATRLGLVIL